MRKRNETKTPTLDFPPNFDWNRNNNFVPRMIDGAALELLAQSFLRNDTAFQHLLRQCKKKWIVVLVLGAHTANLSLYDPADVDDPLRKPLSSNLTAPHTVFFETDRHCALNRIAPARRELIATARPFLQADRLLKPTEIALLLTLEQAAANAQFESELKVDPEGDQEMVRMAAETTQRTSTPKLSRSEIQAMGQDLFSDLPVR